MQRSILFLFFALFATVLGQGFQPKRCNVGQKKADRAVIRQQFTNYREVCDWYLTYKRNRVPTLKTFTVPTSKRAINRFSSACECIVKKRRSTRGTPRLARPAGFTPKCTVRAQKLLAAEVKQPKQFCLLWSQLQWRATGAVPFGGNMNIKQIYNACDCAINGTPTTTDEPTTTEEPESSTTDDSSDSSTTDDSDSSTTDDAASATTTDAPTTTDSTTSSATTTTDSTTTSTMTTTSTTTTTTSTTTSATATSTGLLPIRRNAIARPGRQYSNGKRAAVEA